jgi:hypothetical protein
MPKVERLKEAETDDQRTILFIESVREGLDICFNVKLLTDGKQVGFTSYNTYNQALNKFYDLIEVGVKFNGYKFKRYRGIASL